uniref:hypothetical protein n=1 Tax=Synechococcus sp. UW106 TaxID=368495 RepID=UPI0010BDCB94|nr:hypothetical protein [Synechococcus sp. UW106]
MPIIASEKMDSMKASLRLAFFLAMYVLMCFGVLVLAVNESTAQPIGLLVVAMVMMPIIVSICGGLPVDFIKSKAK